MAVHDNARETGATKYPAKEGADPSDRFSQDAAGNKRPRNGIGLTRRRGQGERQDAPVRWPKHDHSP